MLKLKQEAPFVGRVRQTLDFKDDLWLPELKEALVFMLILKSIKK